MPLENFYIGDGKRAIAYGHLYTVYNEVIHHVPYSSNDNSSILSKYGDLLFPSSSTVPFGTAKVSAILIDNVKIGGDIIIARNSCNKYSVNPYFISYSINFQKKKLFPIIVGTTITHMYSKDLEKISYFFPTEVEQQKIVIFFQTIDHLITLHQRKLDLLKQLKKAYLQVMFPAKDEKIPKVRFANFEGDWEERKLSELGDIMTGTTPSTNQKAYYSDDGIPFVTPTDIYNNIINGTLRKLSKEGEKVGSIVPANTILVTCIASIGKNALLQVKGSFNQQINSLTPNDKNDAYFLFTESVIWSEKMKRQVSSSTIQIINKAEFSKIKTLVPNKTEQTIIGTYFRYLDNLNTFQQSKVEHLQKLKKAYLKNMFI